MVSITPSKIFIYFFFLTFLIAEVYPQNTCLYIRDPCKSCLCSCEEHVPKEECPGRCASSFYYNLNDKITTVKKWIEKKLENEYIHYFKYDEFKINEEEIGRERDIRIPMVLLSYLGRHFGKVFYLFLPSFNKRFLTVHFFRSSFVFLVTVTCEFSTLYKGFGWVPGDWRW
ncbi:hypothetical protein RhiirC2_869905 [Rhizophagus irregularis]|uniref:Uncharacterized protein n=1 Tax=Rhizophagus irregularis TaxID=588596 RepID=A0A2N1MN83_9GLOM|nr:hypothetical protein RhiirC2_869905 [Rhizophagus irregularis]